MMIFKTPEMLLLLAVIPIFGKLLARSRRLQRRATEELRGLDDRSKKRKNRADRLRLSALALIVFALARPAWNPHPKPVVFSSRDLVVALDISRSMLAADVFPTRLDAARISLLENLDALRGQRIGLITFAGSASVRVPLTLDHHFVRYILERISPADADVGSTSIQAAIEKAIDVVLPESDKGRQDLIIFTDGDDLLSNIEKTAEQLRDCGARVLLIGLGDPVEGARIPDITNTNAWMQYKGSNVITRLNDETLKKLAAESPNVTYYPARNRPFDLLSLYQKIIADTATLSIAGKTEMVYTEGWPFFIAAALLFWMLTERSFLLRRIPFLLIPLLMLFSGCRKDIQSPEKTTFAQHYNQGCELWKTSAALIESDPRAALPQLESARAEFLRAALVIPGELKTAQQIAGLSAQIRIVTAKIEELNKAEQAQQKKIEEAIKQLQELAQREAKLAQQSQQILTKRPPVPPEQQATVAAESLIEQESVRKGTGEVLDIIEPYQKMIQKMMKTMYGETETPPPTEFDQAVDLLAVAVESQHTAIKNLVPEATSWPQANPALRIASSKMNQALEALSDQSAGKKSEKSDESSDQNNWDFDENAEWSQSDADSNLSMPMSSQNFKTALENKALPAPNYTMEDIRTEEAANQAQRAQQKAARAGSNVEKNW